MQRTLFAQQRGTKKFTHQYGEWLVCVRYHRDDAEGRRKITTVEIVAEERPWHPAPRPIPDDAYLPLKVEYGEVAIGNAIRAAGGQWYPQENVWRLRYLTIVALGFTDRIGPD